MYPTIRPRRLRINNNLRRMVRETTVTPDDFVYPLFVRPGTKVKKEISAMPGNYQWSVDMLPAECEEIAKLGIPAVLLFGIPEARPVRNRRYCEHGVIQVQ